MADADLLIELTGVTKDYRALRPLRVQHLQLHERESVALLGFDAAMTEVLVNLITGAQLPDQGEVHVFGRPTSSINAVDDWVTELDRFGLISTRSVLVEQFTAEQNLALPLTLEVDELHPDVKSEVGRLAAEVGLSKEELNTPTGDLGAQAQLRLRVGRALALRPRVLLAEHPNALLSREEASKFADEFARITAHRAMAALVMTADPAFARAVASRVLEVQPATGALLKKKSGLLRWFS